MAKKIDGTPVPSKFSSASILALTKLIEKCESVHDSEIYEEFMIMNLVENNRQKDKANEENNQMCRYKSLKGIEHGNRNNPIHPGANGE